MQRLRRGVQKRGNKLRVDIRKKGFIKECRRQCLLLKNDPHEKEIMKWLEAVADRDGWKA